MIWYALLIAAVAVERVAELVVSPTQPVLEPRSRRRRVRRASLSGDGRVAHRPAGGMPGGGVALIVRSCRRWAGRCWRSCWLRRACAGGASRRSAASGTPASSSSPMRARVTGGPYRFFSHPNYVAVVVEGIALPLVHTAWITAAGVHGAQRCLCCGPGSASRTLHLRGCDDRPARGGWRTGRAGHRDPRRASRARGRRGRATPRDQSTRRAARD